MIQRDYILRAIQEFAQALARVVKARKHSKLDEAALGIERVSERFIGLERERVEALSETDLIAWLVKSGSTFELRGKTLMLVALLKEAGDLHQQQQRPSRGQACFLKALHLLMRAMSEGREAPVPDFVPSVEGLVEALLDGPLPEDTQIALMLYYEQLGAFAKAEDFLFRIAAARQGDAWVREFGQAFYDRLLKLNDPTLALGALPRPEVLSGMKELREWRPRPGSGS